MSFLTKVTKGKIKKPVLALIHGVPGVGKSTWASQSPSPIFLGKEDGTNELDVHRFPQPKSFKDVMQGIHDLTMDDHDYKTLVIDSLDWIEPLVWEGVCELDGSTSIDKAQGSYGKGYNEALKFWIRMIDKLTILRETKKMGIILIAHTHVKAFNDPNQAVPYDRYQLKLNDKAAAIWKEYVDFIGFATFKVTVNRDKGQPKEKAMGDGSRVLYTNWKPAFDAKNRYGITEDLPLNYMDFEKAMNSKDPEVLKGLLSELAELTVLVHAKDQDKGRKMSESVLKVKDDTGSLMQIRDRARFILAQ